MLVLALILALQTPPQTTPEAMARAEETAVRATADAARAAHGVDPFQDEYEGGAALICEQAQEAKAAIVRAAVRLGERDADLMAAWAMADRIERRSCLVAAQADGVNAPDL